MSVQSASLIYPDWPAPKTVKAFSTTRLGGVSRWPYDSLNLGDHVGDSTADVAANRRHLQQLLGEQVHCQWLQQVHGTKVIRSLEFDSAADRVPEADASVSQQQNIACLVMTADCLPVLFCDRAGTRVAAAHAGWRGLADGVLEATLSALECPAEEVICWLGPAIAQDAFEVGDEVRQRFCDQHTGAETAFKRRAEHPQKWFADLYALARLRLSLAGVAAVYGGNFCTFGDSERFFSYRRDGQTGRMASLVWLSE